MNRFQTYLSLLLALSCSACNQDAAGPVALHSGDENAPAPLEIAFKPLSGSFTLLAKDDAEPSCGLSFGRQQVYDPVRGDFHIHFKSRNYTRSSFEVTKVAERFTRPVVFRLSGDTRGDGCLGRDLTLSVDGKDYPLEESKLWYGHVDKTLFHVERKQDVLTVAFTKKGEALLKPGAEVWLMVDTGW